jgi:hypothetical protein
MKVACPLIVRPDVALAVVGARPHQRAHALGAARFLATRALVGDGLPDEDVANDGLALNRRLANNYRAKFDLKSGASEERLEVGETCAGHDWASPVWRTATV